MNSAAAALSGMESGPDKSREALYSAGREMDYVADSADGMAKNRTAPEAPWKRAMTNSRSWVRS